MGDSFTLLFVFLLEEFDHLELFFTLSLHIKQLVYLRLHALKLGADGLEQLVRVWHEVLRDELRVWVQGSVWVRRHEGRVHTLKSVCSEWCQSLRTLSYPLVSILRPTVEMDQDIRLAHLDDFGLLLEVSLDEATHRS